MTNVAVLGSGGWGTALSVAWARAGHEVRLWTPFPEECARLAERRENPLLRGVVIPEGVRLGTDLAAVVAGLEVVVLAVPSRVIAETARAVKSRLEPDAVVVSVAKGLDRGADGRPRTLAHAIEDALEGAAGVAALSGPSHAEEVGRGLATTVVVAGDRAEFLRDTLSTPALRIYTSPDRIGVELGGALKNPIAIAAGIAAGLGLGDNAMGALVTRGIAEVTRLGVAAGADPRTFAGLSGIGDLVTTCISPHSRNRRVGRELAEGRNLDVILADLGMVAEGVEAARVADAWGRDLGVETPIISAVARVLFEGSSPARELHMLMSRTLKDEFSG